MDGPSQYSGRPRLNSGFRGNPTGANGTWHSIRIGQSSFWVTGDVNEIGRILSKSQLESVGELSSQGSMTDKKDELQGIKRQRKPCFDSTKKSANQ
jgi:hypothetical protein